MRRALPAVLAALLLAAGTVGLLPRAVAPAAYAAPCPSFQASSAAGKADVVFHGRVIGKPTRSDRDVLTYRVSVLIPFKGSAGDRVRVHLRPGACRGAQLTASEDFVFFLQERKGRLIAPGGQPSVRPYSEQLNQEMHTILDEPDAAVDPVTFAEPEGGEPRAFTRLAAPGAALVVVGVLGLLLIRWLSRRG